MLAQQLRVVDVRDGLGDVALAGAEAAHKTAPGEDEAGGEEIDPLGGGLGPLGPVQVGEEVEEPALLAAGLLAPLLLLVVVLHLLLFAGGAGLHTWCKAEDVR